MLDGTVSWINHWEVHSYPYEYPRVTFEEVALDEGLWYTSGIESFISTMETSALAGKNVAELMVDRWVWKDEGGYGGEGLGTEREWGFEGLGGAQKPLREKM